MTALTDIQRRAYASSLTGRAVSYGFLPSLRYERRSRDTSVGVVHYAFDMLQKRGFITHMMLAVIAGAILAYLIAIYSLFGLGVTLQQKSIVLKELTDTNRITELNLGQRQTEFAKNNEDILQSMEKISDLRYVLPADTSVSRADIINGISQ